VPEIDKADGTASAAEQAEKRTEETHRFMRSVRRATRRKYTSDRLRPVSQGRDQPCQLLLMDQGVHGGREGEADTQHCARCHPAKRSSSSSVRTVT